MPPKKVTNNKKQAEQPVQVEPVKQQAVAIEQEKEEIKAPVIEAEPERVQTVQAPEIENHQNQEATHSIERKLSESEVSAGKSKQGKILVLADKNNKSSAQSSTVISLNKVNIPAKPKVDEDFEEKKKLREVRFGTNVAGEATTEETLRVNFCEKFF